MFFKRKLPESTIYQDSERLLAENERAYFEQETKHFSPLVKASFEPIVTWLHNPNTRRYDSVKGVENKGDIFYDLITNPKICLDPQTQNSRNTKSNFEMIAEVIDGVKETRPVRLYNNWCVVNNGIGDDYKLYINPSYQKFGELITKLGETRTTFKLPAIINGESLINLQRRDQIVIYTHQNFTYDFIMQLAKIYSEIPEAFSDKIPLFNACPAPNNEYIRGLGFNCFDNSYLADSIILPIFKDYDWDSTPTNQNYPLGQKYQEQIAKTQSDPLVPSLTKDFRTKHDEIFALLRQGSY